MFAIRALRTEPERQRCDLRRPWVDLNAEEVVPEDQPGQRAVELAELGIVLSQRRARTGRRGGGVVVPGLFVDGLEEIECVEKEVAGPAGWVEDLDIPRILLLPRQLVRIV